MPTEVIFDRMASREYVKARRWFATRAGEQLAGRFTAEVNRTVQRIAEKPDTIGTEFRRHYRWVRLRRFPYLIYYRVASRETVVVLAVALQRRRLGYWMRRDKE